MTASTKSWATSLICGIFEEASLSRFAKADTENG